MNVNSIPVLLGCAGLAIGGIGLLAQETGRPDAEPPAVHGAAWPPPAQEARVAFNDEMVALLTLGAKPRAGAEPVQQPQAVPAEGETGIRSIRMVRVGGSRRARVADIEFIDPDGRTHRRRFPVGDASAAANARELESGQSASEANEDAPRRGRRSGRNRRRGW